MISKTNMAVNVNVNLNVNLSIDPSPTIGHDPGDTLAHN